jgi:hypothetical protein
VAGVTGQYFANRTSKTANKVAYHSATAARLWQVSQRLTDMGTGA